MTPIRYEDVAVDMVIPSFTRRPGALDLFMFSAGAWLLHRIHYDQEYTREHEGHPDLLVHGPLQGIYMAQVVTRWLGRAARIESLKYRHQAPAYVGEELRCGGSVPEKDDEARSLRCELWVEKSAGDRTTVGEAIVAFR
jgi:hydroxyacyl-ACP dehydratase HTD2-like protein with hotdog domain